MVSYVKVSTVIEDAESVVMVYVAKVSVAMVRLSWKAIRVMDTLSW